MNKGNKNEFIVSIVTALLSFIASLLAAILVFNANQNSNKLKEIQTQLQIDFNRFQQEQFNRDLERKYIELFFSEIVSKDPRRQTAALSLLKIVDENTGIKLLAWAKDTGVLSEETKTKTNEVKKQLDSRTINSRFRLFLHLGLYGQRTVPSEQLIDRDLSASGFVIFGKDNQVDKYGPGVDYFHAEDRSGAETICRILNELISDAKYKLKPRIQSADQPIGTIGIWF